MDYDVSNDAFLSGRGSATLIVRGFSVTLDTRALSHDLHPLGWAGGDLSPGTHAITLMPGKDCAFVSASGIVADFTLTVEADGTVVVDRPSGFAEVSGQTVTIKGYRITLDTRTLSHDLRPLLLGWAGGTCRRNPRHHTRAREGLCMHLGQRDRRDFTLTVEADGTVVVDPPAGFAEVNGATVGHQGLPHHPGHSHPVPRSAAAFIGLGWRDLWPGTHAITLVPGKSLCMHLRRGIVDFTIEEMEGERQT